jgi:hypothetical protein
MPEATLTTIKLKTTTKEKLADFGKKSETYDQIVLRLLEEIKSYRENTHPHPHESEHELVNE